MPLAPSQMNQETAKKEGMVLILSGPSGTGKTTLLNELRKKLPELRFNTSHTTRCPRKNEIDGRDYYFISEKEFQTKKERGDFLEWALFNDNYYGTSFESLKNSRDTGHDVILELDLQGAKNLRKQKYPGIFIFLLPPSIEELSFRLRDRSTESEKIIKLRLERAIEEIKGCMAYDYIIISRKVEESVKNFISIFKAEQFRASRFVPASEDIQALLNSREKD